MINFSSFQIEFRKEHLLPDPFSSSHSMRIRMNEKFGGFLVARFNLYYQPTRRPTPVSVVPWFPPSLRLPAAADALSEISTNNKQLKCAHFLLYSPFWLQYPPPGRRVMLMVIEAEEIFFLFRRSDDDKLNWMRCACTYSLHNMYLAHKRNIEKWQRSRFILDLKIFSRRRLVSSVASNGSYSWAQPT